MEELLDCLQVLESSGLPDDDTIVLHVKRDPIVQRISSLASVVLISDEGQNLWENHRILLDKGYPVTPGEKDRFGWLSGNIHTRKGIIVFG